MKIEALPPFFVVVVIVSLACRLASQPYSAAAGHSLVRPNVSYPERGRSDDESAAA